RGRALAMTFVGGGVALAGVGLLQRALHARRILGLYRPDWWGGFMATFVDGNHAAGVFLLVLGGGPGLVLAETEWRRRLGLLAALAMPMAALLLTSSRGGLLGLAGLTIVTFLLGRQDRRRRTEQLVVGSLVGVMMLVCFFNTYQDIEARV